MSSIDPANIYHSYEAHIAAAFWVRACESQLGVEETTRQVLNMDLEELGTIIRSGDHHKFTNECLLDALIYLHGHTLSRDMMNAAQDRAGFRRRKAASEKTVHSKLLEHTEAHIAEILVTKFNEELRQWNMAKREASGRQPG